MHKLNHTVIFVYVKFFLRFSSSFHSMPFQNVCTRIVRGIIIIAATITVANTTWTSTTPSLLSSSSSSLCCYCCRHYHYYGIMHAKAYITIARTYVRLLPCSIQPKTRSSKMNWWTKMLPLKYKHQLLLNYQKVTTSVLHKVRRMHRLNV